MSPLIPKVKNDIHKLNLEKCSCLMINLNKPPVIYFSDNHSSKYGGQEFGC